MKQNAKRLLKSLWIRACRLDEIPINSKFVVFSDDNKYAVRYNKIACLVASGSSQDSQNRCIVWG